MGRGVRLLTQVQPKLPTQVAEAVIDIKLREWIDFHPRYFCEEIY